jgi:hypothetical protein
MCKETTTWHSCGHGSEATVHCWRHRDGGGGDHVDCKYFSQPSVSSKSKCVKCKETQKLDLALNPYTSLFSATGVPTEEAFCDTKIAIAKSARKVRTQTQELARTIAHPLGHTQTMAGSLTQLLNRNNVVVQCLDKILHSKKSPGHEEKSPPDYEDKPPTYEEKQGEN